MNEDRVYIAIDLKSFYASVECVERKFDPLTTNLVVADMSRTEKTICLAVTPSLKAYGISGRARLFEVVQRVKEVNRERLNTAIRGGYIQKDENGKYNFTTQSFDANALAEDPSLELSYFVAPPRMKLYEDYALERIPFERYSEYAGRYEAERNALKGELAVDQQNLALYTEDSESIDRFLALADRFTDLSALTDEMILSFVDKILVHEPIIMDGERTQEVEIFLKHIGKMEIEDAPTPSPTAEEIASEAKRKKKRAYHRQYYREKIKPRKEAQKAATQ